MMDDLISRRATMDEISKQQTYKMFYGEDTMYFDANDVASVLASMPSAQPDSGYIEQIKWERDLAIRQLADLGYGLGEKPRTNGDLISRQAAIDAVNEYLRLSEVSKTVRNMTSIQAILRWLPSAERKGKWIDMNTLTTMYMPRYKCSICDEWANKSNYCPYCGADMRERKEK